ncbi:hypothetical protein D3C81_1863420 [compost metagenome]
MDQPDADAGSVCAVVWIVFLGGLDPTQTACQSHQVVMAGGTRLLQCENPVGQGILENPCGVANRTADQCRVEFAGRQVAGLHGIGHR